ncbi:FtsX-like permease family protein [candidate division KSB1 bacterium]|nr:FtsX-like permease family protein [candidate division KSB1 bacterium]
MSKLFNPTSLLYFWRINLAVLLGAAVATAVLTGALLVGDSVRGSLRDLTLERLGKIDHALVSDKFFRQQLAPAFANDSEFNQHFEAPVPAILLNGTAIQAKSKARAAKINISGVNQEFASLLGNADDFSTLFSKAPQQIFPSVIINAALQKELQAEAGDQILLSFPRPSGVHRESLLGRKETSDLVETIRLMLTAVIPDRGAGRFGLLPNQSLPRNAFVSLVNLQKAFDETDHVNALLVASKTETPAEASLQNPLRRVITLNDLGLTLRKHNFCLSLESRELILKPQIAAAVESIATELGAPTMPVLTYLANTMTAKGKLIPYSTVSALNSANGEILGSLELADGTPAPELADDEIFLNTWAATDLRVASGDTIVMNYYAIGSRGELFTQSARFRLKGILLMTGLAADRTLTPEFPGIHDADDMGSWNPPFPVDLNLIRPKDEAYWDEFRATPKAFVSLQTGQRLWSSRFGDLTAIRFGAALNSDLPSTREIFQKKLLERLDPEQNGFVFQPVKEQGLRAAAGATDFSMLFIGFSFFLIISAALLAGLLFRLSAEQRAKEIGLLLAAGYLLRTVRRSLMIEGGILAGIGCLVGLGGAILYAALLMAGLRTWWVAAVGTSFLSLHVNFVSLTIGYFAAVLVVLFSIWWAIRQLGKIPTTALLNGVTNVDEAKPQRFARTIAIAASGLAGLSLLIALLSGVNSSAALFFATGALLLIAGFSFLSLWFRQQSRKVQPNFGTARMSARNTARHPGRSLLCAALVGCACFVIVAVGANRREFGREQLMKNSGTGGFTLLAESDIPLHHDLNTPTGRFELGISETDSAVLNRAHVIPLRLLPGEDASCLNLYQPEKPRVLGVPSELIKHGGFQFQATTAENGENPWQLLEQEIAPGVIPAFGDYNSVMWILHLGLGKDLVMQDEFGSSIKLRLLGLLQSSIFQSEIIISEANFLKHFPSQSGYSYFLIETPITNAEATTQILESALSDYGFDVTSTTEKLANYQAVENTYLSVFQMLGGLGLLLGTLGLGIILIRNVIERRGELATLRAFGFRRSTLAKMLVSENSFLIICGILIGSFSALVAVLPHLLGGHAQTPWLSLIFTLALVFMIGLIASLVAVSTALRIPLLPALKAEN